MAKIAAVAAHVRAVPIDIAVFPAKLGPFAIGCGIIVVPKCTAKLPAIVFDLGLITPNIAFIVADVL